MAKAIDVEKLDPRIQTGVPAQVKVAAAFFIVVGLSWLLTAVFGVSAIRETAAAALKEKPKREPIAYAVCPFVVSWKNLDDNRRETWIWFFGYTKLYKAVTDDPIPEVPR